MDYTFILYVFFGVLPSLSWLFYYLRKDRHPESKRMVLKIFLYGALITLPVFFAQMFITGILDKAGLPPIFRSVLYWFVAIALAEEFFKYLLVKEKILNNPEFDEPLDVMLYMVISALGFAALENILYLVTPANNLIFTDVLNRTLIISLIRFIGATFLHTLCSAVIGYFLALSFLETKKHIRLVILGFLISTSLHGFYNFSIMTVSGPMKFIIPISILVILAFFVFAGFEKLSKAKSICKIT